MRLPSRWCSASLITLGCGGMLACPTSTIGLADAALATDAPSADAAHAADGSLASDSTHADTVMPFDAMTATDRATFDAATPDRAVPDGAVPDGAPRDAMVADGDLSGAVDPHCHEVIPGRNSLTGTRVNVVFFFAGFDAIQASTTLNMGELFRAMVEGVDDHSYDFDPTLAHLYRVEGLDGIEPYGSNRERFNYWYVDQPVYSGGDPCPAMNLSDGASCSAGTLHLPGGSSFTLDTYQAFLRSSASQACDLPLRYVNIIYNKTAFIDPEAIGAPSDFALFGAYAQESLAFGATTSPTHLFPIFVHEFTHALAQVYDEKGSGASSDPFTSDLLGPNCFSLAASESALTPQACAASAQLPWHDLMGNGCGRDGIVDCPKTLSYHEPNLDRDLATRDDEWLYEVRDDVEGCGVGCMYVANNIFRPFVGCNVMSSCDLDSEWKTGPFTRLGPVNEREACRVLRTLTGGASATCQLLCLDGCAFGQRCVAGECVSAGSIH